MFGARIICPVLLFVIIAGHIAHNAAWLACDDAPFMWDQAGHLQLSLKYCRDWRSRDSDQLLEDFQTLDPTGTHSQMMHCTAGFFCSVFGIDRNNALIVQQVSLAVLCICIYLLGNRLAGPWCGLIAAFVTMAMPGMFGMSRQFLLEMPTIAAAMLFVCCIVLRDDDWAIWFVRLVLATVAAAVGMLVRETFLMYIAGSCAVVFCFALLRTMRGGKPEKRAGAREFALIVIALAGGGLTAWLMWYGPNFETWFAFAASNFSGEIGAHFTMGLGEFLMLHLRATHLPYFALLLVILLALRYVYYRSKGRPERKFRSGPFFAVDISAIAAGYLLPLLVCMISVDRVPRFLYTASPFLGLALAYLLMRVSRGWIKYVAAAGLLYLLFPLYFLSWCEPIGPADAAEPYPQSACRFVAGLLPMGMINMPPSDSDWCTGEIIRYLDSDFVGLGGAGGVDAVCLPSTPRVQGMWFKYVGEKMYMDGVTSRRVFVESLPNPLCPEDEDFERKLNDYAVLLANKQYVIVKTGYNGDQRLVRYNGLIGDLLESPAIGLFVRMEAEFRMPDGTVVVIYRHKYIMNRPDDSRVVSVKNRFMEAFKKRVRALEAADR